MVTQIYQALNFPNLENSGPSRESLGKKVGNFPKKPKDYKHIKNLVLPPRKTRRDKVLFIRIDGKMSSNVIGAKASENECREEDCPRVARAPKYDSNEEAP
jgi:hypothetical protein